MAVVVSPDTSVFSVVSPRTPMVAKAEPLAARLTSLEGKKLAFGWTHRYRGDEIWELLKEALNERYPGMSFVGFEEFGSTHGGDEREVLAALGEKLKSLNVDGFVSGMGC